MDKIHQPSDVANYMKERLEAEQYLYQEVVVYEILEKFGEEFVYHNENDNLAIDPKVLSAFRRITPDVVWERGDLCWRKRECGDDPDSRAQD